MAAGRPNNVLRALMQRAELSASDLAQAVNAAIERRFGQPGNATDRHVRRWLSGKTALPQLHYLVGIMDVFQLQSDQLGFTLTGTRSQQLAQLQPRSTLLETNHAEEDHVLRRQFMIAGAGNLLSVAFAPLPTSGRIGASDVDRIRESIDRLHAVDDAYGGEQLADIAESFVQQIEAAMGRCLYGPRVEQALYQVIGQLHASAGWFAFDSGDQPRASRNFDSGLRASLLANDRQLQARIWAYMSRQSWELGRATETVTIARAALDATRNSRDHRLSALLHGRLALGYAASGQGAQCGTALARAETALDRIGDATAEAWLAFVGPGEVMGSAAMAHMNLGQPDRAAYQEEQGMTLLDPAFRRNRFAKSVHLAECYLAANQVEQAVGMADQALDLYPSVNCPRWAVHLGQFREKVAGFDLPIAAGFVERYDVTTAS
ncbi:hypothetical protein [Streptomyces sp. NRRL S-350]|uniref:hypothetical protein n=1 Tax=Streptomyces sp. NRRL S-350 TaxID=1463902 RepID=UPI00131EBFA8|nr:hypothetical protein [Streptomyces sp. NRRL S-350]